MFVSFYKVWSTMVELAMSCLGLQMFKQSQYIYVCVEAFLGKLILKHSVGNHIKFVCD